MTLAGLLKAETLTAALFLFGGAADQPAALAPRQGAGWELAWAGNANGRVHLTVTAAERDSGAPLAKGNPAALFDRPFYVMADLAEGGRLSEENNAKGLAAKSFPAQFAVDWIRVYRCAADPDTGRACMR